MYGTMTGDTLSRPPAGFPKDHPAIELLKHKQFLAGRKLTKREVQSSKLPETLSKYFEELVPFLEFFATAK